MRLLAEERVERVLIQAILAGDYTVGNYLPPERELAEEMNVSRPVVHKAMIRLEGKGLVQIIPRQGVRVMDYREFGKLELFEALYEMYKWKIDVSIHHSILTFVKDTLLHVLLENQHEFTKPYKQNMLFTENEDFFKWMHHYAMASENLIYAMLFNEFKKGIVNVSTFLLSETEVDYQKYRHRIDAAVQEREVEKIKEYVENLFEIIEVHWIRRCEDEAKSSR
ncbi:GntR family transcriptional regulator [Fusibacter tunisiensis]|uniref:DNA-binding FadR family transcriptional regulator n=1 Tax=Fusibacter tunisiensis TaxID=1008308 RepID=A0ABS2MTP0_9FIRM|nr:GntR family transcriptional regulator [Fusibacter tunisiensis]MBM7562755.1 DNA-binding FadR family transcriptional regulator [Fusibacter tunisiensis]